LNNSKQNKQYFLWNKRANDPSALTWDNWIKVVDWPSG